jgi:hypothetical protein
MEESVVDAVDEDAQEEGVVVDETPQAVKDLAKELGWNENFDDNPDKFVDAATFIRRSRDINSGLRKQIKEITNVVSELKTHNKRVYKAEVQRLTEELTTLKAQRKTAIEDGDVERVEKIESKIEDIKEKTSQPPAPVPNTGFDEWVEENPWYRNDDDMRKFADKAGLEYEGLPFQKILKLVRKDVEAEFPDKFKKAPGRPGASPVESGSRRSSSKTRSEADLTAAQKDIMHQFIRHGVMTKAEYISDLVKRGEI